MKPTKKRLLTGSIVAVVPNNTFVAISQNGIPLTQSNIKSAITLAGLKSLRKHKKVPVFVSAFFMSQNQIGCKCPFCPNQPLIKGNYELRLQHMADKHPAILKSLIYGTPLQTDEAVLKEAAENKLKIDVENERIKDALQSTSNKKPTN